LSRGAETVASAITIGVKPAKNPMSRRRRNSCTTEVTSPIAATMTTKPISERMSITLRPKRSASRPKTGERIPEIAGVTAAWRPDHSAIFAGSVTPRSRM
jgi:hypothetical protein